MKAHSGGPANLAEPTGEVEKESRAWNSGVCEPRPETSVAAEPGRKKHHHDDKRAALSSEREEETGRFALKPFSSR